jgi:hypothetical protein
MLAAGTVHRRLIAYASSQADWILRIASSS